MPWHTYYVRPNDTHFSFNGLQSNNQRGCRANGHASPSCLIKKKMSTGNMNDISLHIIHRLRECGRAIAPPPLPGYSIQNVNQCDIYF